MLSTTNNTKAVERAWKDLAVSVLYCARKDYEALLQNEKEHPEEIYIKRLGTESKYKIEKFVESKLFKTYCGILEFDEDWARRIVLCELSAEDLFKYCDDIDYCDLDSD